MGFIDRRQAKEVCKKWREEDLEAMRKQEITIGTLRRCLKIYDPSFVSFWNAKREYKQFHNDIGLLILKLEAQQKPNPKEV